MSADDPPARARALDHVASLSRGEPLDPSLRVTLNFHPDRVSGGRTVLDGLAGDGFYVSQFVTGTSNGGLTARPGGDRWRWESRIFRGAYDAAPPHERPVYGALNFRRHAFGAAPRFGSAHLRLTAPALARSTYCYPDSAAEPSDFGVAATGGRLVTLAEADGRDALDDYVEAHVHGPVRLDGDVEALVLDPCFRGTEGRRPRHGCRVRWSGTADSGFPSRSWSVTRSTGAGSTSNWAPRSRSTAGSTRG